VRTSFIKVVDLVAGLAHLDLRVDDARRPDDLLDDARGVATLELPRCRRNEHELVGDPQELVERLRPVVERAGQAEPVVHQGLLARAVALVHPADLRHGLVGLVDEADEVVGEVVDQAVGPVARVAPVEDPRVVLDPRTEPDLPEHLHVVLRALPQAV